MNHLFHRTHSPTRVKVIFNPISGIPGESPMQLMRILTELQAIDLAAEVHIVQPDSNLRSVIQSAYRRGFRLFIACGGDGTVDAVANALAGTRAAMGIIPTGTRNNVALSLGIPMSIPGAVALLQEGRTVQVDMGLVTCGEARRPFLEVCSVGLLSALFPAADDIQRGNLARIGDLLAALVSSPPAEMRLVLDGTPLIYTHGHVVLVTNMPYLGPNYPIASADSFRNGLLEVLVFAKLSKLEVFGAMVSSIGGVTEDPRIHRFQVHRAEIETNPPMPVMVDGTSLGTGPVKVSMQREALTVMVK